MRITMRVPRRSEDGLSIMTPSGSPYTVSSAFGEQMVRNGFADDTDRELYVRPNTGGFLDVNPSRMLGAQALFMRSDDQSVEGAQQRLDMLLDALNNYSYTALTIPGTYYFPIMPGRDWTISVKSYRRFYTAPGVNVVRRPGIGGQAWFQNEKAATLTPYKVTNITTAASGITGILLVTVTLSVPAAGHPFVAGSVAFIKGWASQGSVDSFYDGPRDVLSVTSTTYSFYMAGTNTAPAAGSLTNCFAFDGDTDIEFDLRGTFDNGGNGASNASVGQVGLSMHMVRRCKVHATRGNLKYGLWATNGWDCEYRGTAGIESASDIIHVSGPQMRAKLYVPEGAGHSDDGWIASIDDCPDNGAIIDRWVLTPSTPQCAITGTSQSPTSNGAGGNLIRVAAAGHNIPEGEYVRARGVTGNALFKYKSTVVDANTLDLLQSTYDSNQGAGQLYLCLSQGDILQSEVHYPNTDRSVYRRGLVWLSRGFKVQLKILGVHMFNRAPSTASVSTALMFSIPGGTLPPSADITIPNAIFSPGAQDIIVWNGYSSGNPGGTVATMGDFVLRMPNYAIPAGGAFPNGHAASLIDFRSNVGEAQLTFGKKARVLAQGGSVDFDCTGSSRQLVYCGPGTEYDLQLQNTTMRAHGTANTAFIARSSSLCAAAIVCDTSGAMLDGKSSLADGSGGTVSLANWGGTGKVWDTCTHAHLKSQAGGVLLYAGSDTDINHGNIQTDGTWSGLYNLYGTSKTYDFTGLGIRGTANGIYALGSGSTLNMNGAAFANLGNMISASVSAQVRLRCTPSGLNCAIDALKLTANNHAVGAMFWNNNAAPVSGTAQGLGFPTSGAAGLWVADTSTHFKQVTIV